MAPKRTRRRLLHEGDDSRRNASLSIHYVDVDADENSIGIFHVTEDGDHQRRADDSISDAPDQAMHRILEHSPHGLQPSEQVGNPSCFTPELNSASDQFIMSSPSALLASPNDAFVPCTVCAKPVSSLSLLWFTHLLASELCRCSPGRISVTEGGEPHVECLQCHRVLSVQEQQHSTHKSCVAKQIAAVTVIDDDNDAAGKRNNVGRCNDSTECEVAQVEVQRVGAAHAQPTVSGDHLSTSLLADLLSEYSPTSSALSHVSSCSPSAQALRTPPGTNLILSQECLGNNNFYCSACGVDVDGKASWQLHLVSAKHRTSIRSTLGAATAKASIVSTSASSYVAKRTRSPSPPSYTVPPRRQVVSSFIGSIPGVVLPSSLPQVQDESPTSGPNGGRPPHIINNSLNGIPSSIVSRRAGYLTPPPGLPLITPAVAPLSVGTAPAQAPVFMSNIPGVNSSAANSAPVPSRKSSSKSIPIEHYVQSPISPHSTAPPRAAYLQPPETAPASVPLASLTSSVASSVPHTRSISDACSAVSPVAPVPVSYPPIPTSEPRFISGVAGIKSAAETVAQTKNAPIYTKKGKLIQPASYTYVPPPSNAPPRVAYLMPPGANVGPR
jgi:hypothetical protein